MDNVKKSKKFKMLPNPNWITPKEGDRVGKIWQDDKIFWQVIRNGQIAIEEA